MIKLYYYKFSRASRVRWALEELEAEYEIVHINLKQMENKDEYAKVHPLMQVPALSDNDFHLFKTSAICMYLADKFSKLAPAMSDLEGRGSYYQWMVFAMTELDAKTGEIFSQTKKYPEEKRNALVEKSAREDFTKRAKVLSDHLTDREFMVGLAFTMADVLIASVLGWAEGQKLIQDFPVLLDYRKRMEERPACKRSKAD